VGREFFSHPSLHARVRERLIQAHGSHGRVLLDYVLLPTEIHVLAQLPPGEVAADLARAVGHAVSRWVAQTQPVRSPVLAGPHRAHRITSTAELLGDVRMLAWRPRHVGVRDAPSQHPHGGMRIALGLAPEQGFDPRCLLRIFGDTVPQARAALRAWVCIEPDAHAWRAWESARGLGLTMDAVDSPPHRVQETRGTAGAGGAALLAAGGDGIDGALDVLETWVASRLGLRDAAELRGGLGSTSVRGRALVACLAVRQRLCSASAVARRFGRAKATLSEQMAACKARQGDRPILATRARRIVEETHALASNRPRAGQEGQAPVPN
jgi:hypothetical protein